MDDSWIKSNLACGVWWGWWRHTVTSRGRHASPPHVTPLRSIHNKPVSALWDWTAVDSVPVEARAMLPSTSAIKIELGAGVKMVGAPHAL